MSPVNLAGFGLRRLAIERTSGAGSARDHEIQLRVSNIGHGTASDSRPHASSLRPLLLLRRLIPRAISAGRLWAARPFRTSGPSLCADSLPDFLQPPEPGPRTHPTDRKPWNAPRRHRAPRAQASCGLARPAERGQRLRIRRATRGHPGGDHGGACGVNSCCNGEVAYTSTDQATPVLQPELTSPLPDAVFFLRIARLPGLAHGCARAGARRDAKSGISAGHRMSSQAMRSSQVMRSSQGMRRRCMSCGSRKSCGPSHAAMASRVCNSASALPAPIVRRPPLPEAMGGRFGLLATYSVGCTDSPRSCFFNSPNP